MSSVQNLKSHNGMPSALAKPEVATGEWHQAGDLASGLLARIQKERMRQAAIVASTANDRAVSPTRLAS
jgi:hypothetical protein